MSDNEREMELNDALEMIDDIFGPESTVFQDDELNTPPLTPSFPSSVGINSMIFGRERSPTPPEFEPFRMQVESDASPENDAASPVETGGVSSPTAPENPSLTGSETLEAFTATQEEGEPTDEIPHTLYDEMLNMIEELVRGENVESALTTQVNDPLSTTRNAGNVLSLPTTQRIEPFHRARGSSHLLASPRARVSQPLHLVWGNRLLGTTQSWANLFSPPTTWENYPLYPTSKNNISSTTPCSANLLTFPTTWGDYPLYPIWGNYPLHPTSKNNISSKTSSSANLLTFPTTWGDYPLYPIWGNYSFHPTSKNNISSKTSSSANLLTFPTTWGDYPLYPTWGNHPLHPTSKNNISSTTPSSANLLFPTTRENRSLYPSTSSVTSENVPWISHTTPETQLSDLTIDVDQSTSWPNFPSDRFETLPNTSSPGRTASGTLAYFSLPEGLQESRQESWQQPIQEPRQKYWLEPILEPRKESGEEPIQKPRQKYWLEPILEPRVESWQQPTQERRQKYWLEPILEPREESGQEPIQKPRQKYWLEPILEPRKESRQQPTQELRQKYWLEPILEPREDSWQEPMQEPRQEPRPGGINNEAPAGVCSCPLCRFTDASGLDDRASGQNDSGQNDSGQNASGQNDSGQNDSMQNDSGQNTSGLRSNINLGASTRDVGVQRRQSQSRMRCEFCLASFKPFYWYSRHRRIHIFSEEPPYECNHCSRLFNIRGHAHFRYQCVSCGRPYVSRGGFVKMHLSQPERRQ